MKDCVMYKNFEDMRQSARRRVDQQVDVNEGVPNRGGRLRDISTQGAAIIYPDGKEPVDDPLAMGEIVQLSIGTTALPSKIVRMFDNGFAVQFAWAAGMGERSFQR